MNNKATLDIRKAEDGLDFGALIDELGKQVPEDSIITNDAGNFTSWMHHRFPFKSKMKLIGSEIGAMGMGIPAGIAASLRNHDKKVFVIVGDGGALMTGSELATASLKKAKIIVIVANNNHYGTIRYHQEVHYPKREHYATTLINPNFEEYAKSFGLKGFTINSIDQIQPTLKKAIDLNESVLIEYNMSLEINTSGETNTTANTRNLVTSGSGTIYVKVQNISGQDLFVFSSSPSGTYSLFANQAGFVQGGTYTFDQSDSSNSGHPFRFSTTPDGTHITGGSEMTTGVSTTGSPGTNGTTVLTVSSATPSILYFYCASHPHMGKYQTSPIGRYGTINIHDFWHLDRITKQDRQYLNGQYSYTQSGDGVDIYVIDTGVRGASRPTGNNAALHPELYDPDFDTDLNGTSEQQNYRVYQLSHYAGAYGSNNEDDNGHGTYCAILSAGRTAGVARDAKIYALKAFNSGNSGSYTAILGAYQAVIDHNDSGNVNYKGNTRPAIINASFGPTIPSEGYPYVELNDIGSDNGTDEEMLDDIEGTISSSTNIIVVRAAGNGFKNSSDQFVGPIQTKAIAGSRTAGYPDNTNGGINNVDADQKKICVGASEYNDRWADFSNYGAGVTTVAPGAKILSPAYDWTANTPYTSPSNYNTINGTSFSCPLVTGIIAAYCSKNGYTANTNNLAGTAKTFARVFGATGNISVMGTSNSVSYTHLTLPTKRIV